MAKKRAKHEHQLAMRRKYAAGRNVAIFDKPALAQLFRELVDARFAGSIARAASETGTTRALLRRVLSGEQRSVRADNVVQLRKLAGRRRAEVEAALLTERTSARLAAYDHWLALTTKKAQLGTLEADSGSDLEGQPGTRSGHFYAHDELLGSLKRRFSKEWEPLLRVLQEKKHYANRAQLAFARVIAPLLDYYDSAGMERSPSDFSHDELRAFIKAGVKRECLLLNRDPDVQRAQSPPSVKGRWAEIAALIEQYRDAHIVRRKAH